MTYNTKTKEAPSVLQNQQPVVIYGQYLKDLSFENPNPLAIFNSQNNHIQPQVAVDAKVSATPVGEESEKVFEVCLSIKAGIHREKETLCITEVSYACLVKVNDVVPQDQYGYLLMVQCPNMLFPFTRVIIADATRNANFPPLILEQVDFEKMFEEQQAAAAKAS